MNQKSSLTLKLELIWWVVTLIILFAVLFPIYSNLENYPFWVENIIFILTFVTFTRYIFLLKHTFLAYRQKLKVVFFFMAMFLLFYLVDAINFFQTHIDEAGLDVIFQNFSLEEKTSLASYIRNELVFFGVGSAITTIIFMFRLMISIWRVRNRGTV